MRVRREMLAWCLDTLADISSATVDATKETVKSVINLRDKFNGIQRWTGQTIHWRNSFPHHCVRDSFAWKCVRSKTKSKRMLKNPKFRT